MTHFHDLQPCDYFGIDHGGHLLAVGWLEEGYSYLTGPMDASDYRHLESLLQDPFQPLMCMGVHECDLCQFSGATGGKNLFVPSCGDILVAPELITHYINAHHYIPPLRFIEAIRAVADCRGMEYKKTILRNNGAILLSKGR